MKRSVNLLLGIFLVLTLMSFVSATGEGLITNTTLNDSKVSGASNNIYVNATGCAASCYLGNVTFYWTWYNGTQVTLSTVANDTGNDTVFLYAWDTTAFIDERNGTVNFTSTPYTGAGVNATNSTAGIDLDNGVPTMTLSSATFSSVTQGYNINKGTTFTLGVDSETRGLQSCLIYATDLQNSTVLSSTISVTSKSCSNTTLKPESFLVKGRAYNLVVQGSDENINSTNSSTRRLNYLQASAGSGGSGDSIVGAGTTQGIIGSGFGDTVGNFWTGVKKFFSFKWLTDLF